MDEINFFGVLLARDVAMGISLAIVFSVFIFLVYGRRLFWYFLPLDSLCKLKIDLRQELSEILSDPNVEYSDRCYYEDDLEFVEKRIEKKISR